MSHSLSSFSPFLSHTSWILNIDRKLRKNKYNKPSTEDFSKDKLSQYFTIGIFHGTSGATQLKEGNGSFFANEVVDHP